MSSDTILTEILQASTHYDVLGVETMDLDTATLRKAYLKRSLRVHPDKNDHPDAKQAFQKVAQAWQVLSDDTSRRQYDAALRRGQANMNDDYYNNDTRTDKDDDYDDYGNPGQPRRAPRPETYYAGPPPSMQESLFMFATVVGSMMGGKTAANLSEALYWGEKLMRQQSESKSRSAGLDGSVNEELSAQEKAQMGMALGSGLKVAGSAARALGFTGAAQKMEQSARLAQMASVTVMVAEQPAVKAALQQGTESWRKLRGGMDAVRSVLNHNTNNNGSGSGNGNNYP